MLIRLNESSARKGSGLTHARRHVWSQITYLIHDTCADLPLTLSRDTKPKASDIRKWFIERHATSFSFPLHVWWKQDRLNGSCGQQHVFTFSLSSFIQRMFVPPPPPCCGAWVMASCTGPSSGSTCTNVVQTVYQGYVWIFPLFLDLQPLVINWLSESGIKV